MKTVVYTTNTRLSCSCASSPDVILCLAASGLLAPTECPDSSDVPFDFTTIAATISQAYKSVDSCGNALWHYSFSYDETLLNDPSTPLTAADISGVFCEGCLTDWVKELVGDEPSLIPNADGSITWVSPHGCTLTFTPSGTALQGSWVPATGTWTYASATTVTVPTDATETYAIGQKIRFKQGAGFKYFYVVGVAATTLTLYGGSDYSVANAAITDIYYSVGVSPVGFPEWFNFTTTFGGFSADPASPFLRSQIVGRTMTLTVDMPAAGTSNAQTFTMTAPIVSRNVGAGMKWGTCWYTGADNSAGLTVPGRVTIQNNSTTITIDKTVESASGVWSAAGTKNANFMLTYEI